MTGPPQLGQGMPEDASWIARRFEDLQRQVNELRSARGLEAATIGEGGVNIQGGALNIYTADGLTLLATLDGDGLHVTGNEVVSGELRVTGDTVIEGTLSLPEGIIDNDALANPVASGRYDGTTTGLTLTTTATTLHTGTISVPSGFSTALVMAFVQVGGLNPTGGVDNVRATARIQGVDGDTVIESVSAGFVGHSIAMFTRTVTGLSAGDDVTISVRGATINGGYSGATGRVSAIAVFLR